MTMRKTIIASAIFASGMLFAGGHSMGGHDMGGHGGIGMDANGTMTPFAGGRHGSPMEMQLGLTTDQLTQVQAFRTELNITAPTAAKENLFATYTASGYFDKAGFTVKATENATAMIAKKAAFLEKLYSILTDAQKTKLQTLTTLPMPPF